MVKELVGMLNLEKNIYKCFRVMMACTFGLIAFSTASYATEISFLDPNSLPTQNNVKEAFEQADTINFGINFDIEHEIDLKGRTVTLNFKKVDNAANPVLNFKSAGKLISGDVIVVISEPDKWSISDDKQVAIVQYVNPNNRPYKTSVPDSKIIRMNIQSLSADKTYSLIEYTASAENPLLPIDKIYLKKAAATPITSGDSGGSKAIDDGGGCNAGFPSALLLLVGLFCATNIVQKK